MQYTSQPRITTLPETLFVGLRFSMSVVADRTAELFRNFMPRRREIGGVTGRELYLLKVYPPSYFQHFDPQVQFEKWAAVRVEGTAEVPADMECITAYGRYAVFNYTGTQNEALPAFQYIFQTWLPGSGLLLDDRPHFDAMGENYRNGDPASGEEFWIPVKLPSG